MSESLPQRLDRWIARAGFNLLIPPLILLIPWLQELLDQLIFGGNGNLPMTPGGSFLGVLTAPFSHSYPCVVTQARWQWRTLRVVYGLLCYLLLIGWIEKRPLSFQAHDVIAIPPAQDAGWLCRGCAAVADWACHRR